MTSRKEVTIYDIAKALDLSASTVSRGLRNSPSIRKETVQRIKEQAQSMGYQQNPFASNLRKNRSDTIGVILPRLDSSFQSSVVSGIEKIVNQKGYNLIISQSRESLEKEKVNVKTMFDSRVDGLLVSLACNTCNLEHLDRFLEKGIPVVLFDRVMEHPVHKCTHVVIDNEKAGFDVTEHLIQEGCRRILYLCGDLKSSVYRNRHSGYKRALNQYGLSFQEELTVIDTLDEKSGERAMERISKMEERPDGIFAANDTSAVAIVCELKRAGIRVPEEIAVAGFNDVHISRVIDPPLTTVHYPGQEMGEVAAATLIDMLNSTDRVDAKTVTLEHQLVVRQSSAKRKYSN